MPETTPLLLLLDSVLSQDDERANHALEQIQSLLVDTNLSSSTSPLRNVSVLEAIVERLLDAHPQLAKEASSNDASLPLHFAASIGNPRIAKILLQHYPEAACTRNKKGKIPLHYAAREGRTDFCEYMVRVHPETAAVLSKKGKLALHFAAGEGHLRIVQLLTEVHPEGVTIPSKKGKVALHFASRWGQLQIAQHLCALSPECVQVLDDDGSLPLHDATREGQLELSKFLVERYPASLQVENLRGETPLFPAVRSRNTKLVKFLLEKWPQGGNHVLQRVTSQDHVQDWAEGMLDICLRATAEYVNTVSTSLSEASSPAVPMLEQIYQEHNLSLANIPPGKGLDIVLPRSKSPILDTDKAVPRKKRRSSTTSDVAPCGKRLRVDPGLDNKNESHDEPAAMIVRDYNRLLAHPAPFLQVHAALECGASGAVLEHVLGVHAAQIRQVDHLGRLPLHLAVENGATPATFNGPDTQEMAARHDSVVEIILEKIWKPFPESCEHRDYLGRLPLHLALLKRSDARVVQMLLQSNPCAGIEHCDVVDSRYSDMYPLELAVKCDCDLSTIYMLLRKDPSIGNQLCWH